MSCNFDTNDNDDIDLLEDGELEEEPEEGLGSDLTGFEDENDVRNIAGNGVRLGLESLKKIEILNKKVDDLIADIEKNKIIKEKNDMSKCEIERNRFGNEKIIIFDKMFNKPVDDTGRRNRLDKIESAANNAIRISMENINRIKELDSKLNTLIEEMGEIIKIIKSMNSIFKKIGE